MVAKTQQIGETPLDRAYELRHTVPSKVFDPLGDDVCCYFFPEKEVMSGGGIIIPDNAADRWVSPIAIVIAAGPRCSVKEGDIVLIKGGEHIREKGGPTVFAHGQVAYNNIQYHLIPEYMIAGILHHGDSKEI